MPIPVSTITINSSSGQPVTSTEFNFAAAGGMTISGDSSTNTITFTAFGGLSTPPNSVLITNGSGVASFQTMLPSTVQGNITEVGVISTGVWQSSSPIGIGYGGTGAASMSNPYGAIYYDGSSLATTNVGSAGDILKSNGPGLAPSFQGGGSSTSITILGDTGSATGSSFTISGGGGFLATSFSGTTLDIAPSTALILLYGGTNNNLTASSGSVVYSNATQLALTLSGDSGQILQSAGTGAPVWTTASYPNSTTINQILYSSGTNVVTGLTMNANGVLTTGTLGAPVITTLSSNGQLIIGSGSGAPAAANLTASTGISITNGANSITIANSSPLSGFTVDGDSGSATPSSNTMTISGGTTGLTTSASGSTIDLTGTLKLANGGTNANLTASNGGIFYSTSTAGAILSGTATADLPLLSGSSATPGWASITYPTSASAGDLIYASTATALSALATANNGVLTTGTSGTPVITALASNGQLIIGSGSGAPAAANLTASTGISITNGANSITIANSSPLSGFTVDGDSGSATPSSNTMTISGGTTGLTTSASGSTIDLTGTLKLANGGTNANLTASNGGIFYSTATAGAISPGTATADLPLLSGSSATPGWASITYPTSASAGDLIYASTATALSALATANNGVLTTGTSGTPVITALASNGQLIIGSGSGAPAAANLTASTGISITNGANSITIANSSPLSGFTVDGDSGSATPSSNTMTISGGTTGLTTSASGSTVDLTGTLSLGSGGTNATAMANQYGAIYYDGTKLATTNVGSSGYILTSHGGASAPSFQMGSGSSIAIFGDTGSATGGSFTISGGGGFLTTSFTDTTLDIVPNTPLSLTYGGTNADLTASNGGIFYSTATAGAILPGTATANLPLISGASATPTWATIAYPTTGTATSFGVIYYDGTTLATTSVETSGYILTSNGPGLAPSFQMGGGSSITIFGDTGSATGGSFTISGEEEGNFLQTNFSGTTLYIAPHTPLSLTYGGTNADLTASNGGIFYSTATAGAILSGTATANQILLSGSMAAPSWSTATYPPATTINQLLYSSANNAVTGLATASSAVLTTSSSVPTWASELSLALGGTNANLTASNGGIFYSTATAGAILSGTATANLPLLSGSSTTPGWASITYLTSASAGDLIYASTSSALSALATANNGVLTTGTSGTPVITALASNGQLIIGSGSGAPAAANLTASTGISITNGANSITIANSSPLSGFTVDGDSGSATPSSNTMTISGGTTGLTTSASGSTIDLTGTLKLANGGTNANLTASNGGIFYSTATAGAILSGTATANLPLLSGSSTTPGWASITYPTSASAGDLIYASTSSALSALATANNGVLATNGSGVPSISSTLPSAVQLNISQVGTITAGTWNGTLIGIAYGGTGASSMANTNGVVYYNGTSLVTTSAGTSGYVLTSNGSGSAPTFQVLSDANLILPITFVSTNYTATATDYFISANTSTSAITVELPSAPATGRAYIVKDSQGTSGTRQITVAAGGTVLLDGAASFVINTNYESVNFVFDGTNYEAF